MQTLKSSLEKFLHFHKTNNLDSVLTLPSWAGCARLYVMGMAMECTSLCQQQGGILIYEYLFAPPFIMSCYLGSIAYVAMLNSACILLVSLTLLTSHVRRRNAGERGRLGGECSVLRASQSQATSTD